MQERWRISLFGGLRAEHGDQVVTRFRTQKTGALLAYLAFHLPRSHSRDQLIELLWPETDREAGSNSLSTALSSLRRLLEGPGRPPGSLLVTDRTAVQLNPEAVSTDVAEFEAALRAASAGSDAERREGLERAVTLYQGELLAGSYESWVLGQREWLAETYFQALGRLVGLLEREGDLPRALEYVRQGVLADPLREEGRRDLMRLLAAAGQPAAALRQYQELERLLQEELAAQPSGPTRALARQIEVDPGALLAPPRLSPAQAPPASPRPVPPAAAASGTRTFLLTDVEGSTALWEEYPQAMAAALARHDALAATIVAQHAGTLVKHRGEGDSLFAVFPGACDGVAAALALQRALGAERWPEEIALRVRMALHTGDAVVREGDYLGGAVNRCARLRAIAHGGQILLSRATQELVRDQLPEGASLRDLGECRLKDLARPEPVCQLLHPDLPAEFPPLQTLEAHPNNLPAQPTPLIGREVELAAVQRLLRREGVRLVTLTGAGGTGKTRLGLQIAVELLEEFADGVFFVDLAPIRDPELMVPTIAQALGVREDEGRPLGESLKAFLREKQVLLLLDNFEQVLAAAPRVAELLAGAPRLKVLVTSRAILRLRGEHDFPVPPLALPDRRHLPSRELLSLYAAVSLFIQRAVAARPEFVVTNENAPAVAEICHRLDGLPLAIELAAARIRHLSPEALLVRLERRLPLLTGGARDLPERQQTLRGTITWSYDLLDAAEQGLFRRLSVFVGGCTVEAAEAVCQAAGGAAPARDGLSEMPDGLEGLVEKSLLRQEEAPGGERRFGMLETIREYALEQLTGSGETETLQRRHAQYFLALAERAGPELHGAAQGEWFDRLEREHDNLRAALAWSSASGEPELGLRLGNALHEFWERRGYLKEGQDQFLRLLALPGAAPTAERARALCGAGFFTREQGNLEAARALFEESLASWRRLEDPAGIAAALAELGGLALNRWDPATARARIEESLAIRRELGDQRGMADALGAMAWVARLEGDLAAARAHAEESLAIYRALNDRGRIVGGLHTLASMIFLQEEMDTARSLYEEVLAAARELDLKVLIAISVGDLGGVAYWWGDYPAARALFEQSLALLRDLGHKVGLIDTLSILGGTLRHQADYAAAEAIFNEMLAVSREWGLDHAAAGALSLLGQVAGDLGDWEKVEALCSEGLRLLPRSLERRDEFIFANCLIGMARVALARTNPARAARLLGTAMALWTASITPKWPPWRRETDRNIAAARGQLAEIEFAVAWAAGQAMSIEQAIAEALEEAPDHS